MVKTVVSRKLIWFNIAYTVASQPSGNHVPPYNFFSSQMHSIAQGRRPKYFHREECFHRGSQGGGSIGTVKPVHKTARIVIGGEGRLKNGLFLGDVPVVHNPDTTVEWHSPYNSFAPTYLIKMAVYQQPRLRNDSFGI